MRLLPSLMTLCVLALPACFSPFAGGDQERAGDAGTQVPPDLSGGHLGDRCGPSLPCYEGACCDGTCVDLYRDPNHCGACGIACPSGECIGGDGGVPFCACDTDGGTPGCGSALEPTCDPNGKCTCNGDESGVCAPPWASTCGPLGCQCADQPACAPKESDHCDPQQGCRCGPGPSCDYTTSDHCDPQQGCRCGDGPACAKGSASCCDIASRCCPDNMFCCLDGCCDHPCLFLGFCAK